jgi:hypothetical protein
LENIYEESQKGWVDMSNKWRQLTTRFDGKDEE